MQRWPRFLRGCSAPAVVALATSLGSCTVLAHRDPLVYESESDGGTGGTDSGVEADPPMSSEGGSDAGTVGKKTPQGTVSIDASTPMDAAPAAACPAATDPCKASVYDALNDSCREANFDDCTECGSGGYCVQGRCLPGGMIFEDDFEGDAPNAQWMVSTPPDGFPWTIQQDQGFASAQSFGAGRAGYDHPSLATLYLRDLPLGAVLTYRLRVRTDSGNEGYFLPEQRFEAAVTDSRPPNRYLPFAEDEDWTLMRHDLGAAFGIQAEFAYFYEWPDALEDGVRVWIDDVRVFVDCSLNP